MGQFSPMSQKTRNGRTMDAETDTRKKRLPWAYTNWCGFSRQAGLLYLLGAAWHVWYVWASPYYLLHQQIPLSCFPSSSSSVKISMQRFD